MLSKEIFIVDVRLSSKYASDTNVSVDTCIFYQHDNVKKNQNVLN